MARMDGEVTTHSLQAFAGPDVCGARYEGRDAVRAARKNRPPLAAPAR